MLVGNVTHPGAGLQREPGDAGRQSPWPIYAGAAKQQTVTDFLMNIIPTTMVDAFAKGNILQVLLVAILFGFALSLIGEKGKPVVEFFDAMTQAVFGIVNMLMRLAPIGAFGAMAFTVGRYGIASLGPLAKLIAMFYVTCIVFVLVVMGMIAWVSGFNIIQFLTFIKEEIVIVLATSSSDPALPTLMEKMEKLGCSKSLVGLVVPTGYTFNTDGSSLYMTMAALFVAQATNIHLSFGQQLTIFAVAVLTSKGASGVTGAAFIALVATLMVIPDDSGGGHGAAHRDRPLHEHGARDGQHDRQRRGHSGGGALGKRTRQGHAAEESVPKLHARAIGVAVRRGAGVPLVPMQEGPAVLGCVEFGKIAGGTPAPRTST